MVANDTFITHTFTQVVSVPCSLSLTFIVINCPHHLKAKMTTVREERRSDCSVCSPDVCDLLP